MSDAPLLSDEELVKRAVTAARRETAAPRWLAVMHTFMLGSNAARALCKRFNMDPDEQIAGRR